MTLTDFLLARIAEDEEGARGELAMPARGTALGQSWRDVMSRMLADCEAKRRIVEQFDCTQPPASDAHYAVEQELELALMHLAAVYADHPDYRQEWAL